MTKIEQKIPEGWSVKTLGEFIVFKNGLNTDKEAYGTGTKFVNTMDIFNNNYLYEKNVIGSVKISDKELHKNNVIYGDILFNRTSEIPQEIAFSTIYLDTKNIITFGGFIIRGRPQKNILNPFFSIYCFKSSYFRKEAIRRCQGAIRANIGQNDLSKIKILLPPLPEQEKIAGILSCWDDGIEKLSALIEKKKIQKKALMQQLLTGKHRLKGFSTPWHEVKLGDILHERKEYMPKNGVLEHISLTKEGVVPKTERYERDFLVKNQDKEYKITKLNDICYNPANLKFGVICRNTYGIGIFSPIYVTYEIINQNVNFIGYLCVTHTLISKARRFEEGTVYERMAVSSEDFQKVKIYIPSDLAEQKAIAEILSKADEEIELLNKKLEAFKQEKKALMQQLLTGKIRVKVN